MATEQERMNLYYQLRDQGLSETDASMQVDAILGGATYTPPSSPTSPTAPNAPGDGSGAREIINQTLREFGLQGLGDRAWSQFLETNSFERVVEFIRTSPEYGARFPAMAELAKKGRAITESQYIDLERSYLQVLRQFGVPQGIHDKPSDIGHLINNEVSPVEFQERIQMAQVDAAQAPKETREWLAKNYGLDLGGLTAFFIDPQKALPVLKRQLQAGQVGGAAARTGFGLSAGEAEGLAARGVTAERAQEGFGFLQDASELTRALPGERNTQDILNRQEQIGLVAGDVSAQEKLKRKASRRKSPFEGGGRFATGNTGVSGLSSA